ncbi:MAG TPA: hypothetical protein VFD03_11715 [Clostridia bacterium]|nr:hypothetical protein [Clostridia bacterium]
MANVIYKIATLKDSLGEFYYSREEYIGVKIQASEKHKVAALQDKKHLALKESIKGNTEANDLLFEFIDLCGELEKYRRN